jgi:hypothetical protein
VIAVLLVGMFAGAARASEGGNLDCSEPWSLCAEPESSIGYDGEYTGHDEPSLLFYSNQAGSGNSNIYNLTLPEESRVMPNQAGTGGTWNFQLRPAFWLGMALCDNQSAQHQGRLGSERGRLHRQACRDRVPRAAVLSARLGPVAAGSEL